MHYKLEIHILVNFKINCCVSHSPARFLTAWGVNFSKKIMLH